MPIGACRALSLSDVPFLVLLVSLALASGVCAASETSMFSLTHSDRLRLRRAAPATERIVGALLSRPRRLLLAILLLTNAANVTYFVVSAVIESRIESRWAGLVLNVVSLLALILLADLLPKLLARRQRVAAARVLARPLLAAITVFGPVCGFFERYVVLPLVRLIRPEAGRHAGLDPDELEAVLELSARAGTIDLDEQQMLSDVVGLGQTRVREVMTPRTRMVWIDASASEERVRSIVAGARRERIPVFDGSLDGPALGFLDVPRYVRRWGGRGGAVGGAGGGAGGSGGWVRSAVEPAVFVPERARLDRAFEVMIASGRTTVLVVDEFGAVAGILAISDLVKQVVAPVREADLSASLGGRAPVIKTGDRTWSVAGRLPLLTLVEFLLPAGEHEAGAFGASTVAGLVIKRLGRLAHVGDTVRIGGLRLRVLEMSGRSIERVEVGVESGTDGAAGEGAA